MCNIFESFFGSTLNYPKFRKIKKYLRRQNKQINDSSEIRANLHSSCIFVAFQGILMLFLAVATSGPAEVPPNPLFEVLVEGFRSLKHLKAEDVWNLIINFPRNYEIWWGTLFREAPQHILIETTLIIFIIWLVFIRRTVDPKKTNEKEKLSQREIDWLIETWQPEPLVPQLNEKEKVALSQERVSNPLTVLHLLLTIKSRSLKICEMT